MNSASQCIGKHCSFPNTFFYSQNSSLFLQRLSHLSSHSQLWISSSEDGSASCNSCGRGDDLDLGDLREHLVVLFLQVPHIPLEALVDVPINLRCWIDGPRSLHRSSAVFWVLCTSLDRDRGQYGITRGRAWPDCDRWMTTHQLIPATQPWSSGSMSPRSAQHSQQQLLGMLLRK
jgi:hypothetical protein